MKDDCLTKPWVQEGNRVVTRVIQEESGLPMKKYKVLASTDGARDEEGLTLRSCDKVELARLFAATPDLLEAAREAIEWYDEYKRMKDLNGAGDVPAFAKLRAAIRKTWELKQ